MVDWVDVNDRLPRVKQRVLAYDLDIGVVSARHSRAGWYLEGELDDYARVTHWAELPSGPELSAHNGGEG